MDPHDDGEDVGDDYNPEQEVLKIDGPSLLPQVAIVTGEENDEELTKFRAKIYRWADQAWKERGFGDLKFMANKQINKIRIIMRQDKTGKVIVNHFITAQKGFCELKQLKTSDKAWLWTCYDYSDEEAKVQQLCVKFTSQEEVDRFKTEFEKARQQNEENEKKEVKEEPKQEQPKEEEPKE